jgi:hypothetical protein
MNRQVITIEWECDDCGKTIMLSQTHPALTKGWARRKVYNCGLTGYTRTDELCAACAKKATTKVFSAGEL